MCGIEQVSCAHKQVEEQHEEKWPATLYRGLVVEPLQLSHGGVEGLVVSKWKRQ